MCPSGITAPYYPIVYVRGYAMTPSEREDVFHDAYYGFSATSVEKRAAPAPAYVEADIFEGQFVRLMKLKEYAYGDASNRGEKLSPNPERSIWISRFYDTDYVRGVVRSIEDHAEELRKLICEKIPDRLREALVDLGPGNRDYKVILIAHSMGGLVCRTLIQNLLPTRGEDPKRWIYRFITAGSPHGGIDLEYVPDFLERVVKGKLNLFGSKIFDPSVMREYLKLDQKDANDNFIYDVHSLGAVDGPYSFPVKRCLCVIGSDYKEYGAVQYATGSHSDGLVKQDRAYLVAGPSPGKRPNDDKIPYDDKDVAYFANVHRAHSGYRGIVNSYETFENIHRFLFGDTRAQICVENISIKTPNLPSIRYFYDVEFLASIRNTGVYLHRREQDPCENAMRFERPKLTGSDSIMLHTGFLNSKYREAGEPYSHMAIKLRIIEHQIKALLLWDHEYPGRTIFTEDLEIRLGGDPNATPTVWYRWLSDAKDFIQITPDAENNYRIDLRDAGAVTGTLVIRASEWTPESV